MSSWPWTFGVCRLSIAGIVIDARTSQPVSGASAQITSMPPAFEALLVLLETQAGPSWSTMTERPDLTSTGDDGGFSFVNLPPGPYVVTLSVPGVSPGFSGTYGPAQQAYTVPSDLDYNPTTLELYDALPQIAMPPTGVVGTLVSGNPEDEGAPLPMVRVRVRGSGEIAYTNADGAFYLTSVEPGNRTLELMTYGYSATGYPPSGFDPATVNVGIAEGLVTDIGTVRLGAELSPP